MKPIFRWARLYPSVLASALSVAPLTWAATSDTSMQGMDHSMHGMDHSQMPGMGAGTLQSTQHATPSQSRTPIPALTDADRAAVYDAPGGHAVHDSGINTFLLIDQLEWQDAQAGSAFNWGAKGWVGGDIDRLWLRSEGERSQGRIEKAEVQALWGHSISPWWDLLGGIRQDFKPGDSQTWAAVGLQGMALYNFDTEATAFIGEGGQTALRLEGDYDILLTNKLILQPTAELNLYGKNDPQRGVGSGLSESELGLRLRYEVRREFAPYIGVSWRHLYGKTADYARREGDEHSEARLVLGVRVWF